MSNIPITSDVVRKCAYYIFSLALLCAFFLFIILYLSFAHVHWICIYTYIPCQLLLAIIAMSYSQLHTCMNIRLYIGSGRNVTILILTGQCCHNHTTFIPYINFGMEKLIQCKVMGARVNSMNGVWTVGGDILLLHICRTV